MSKRMKGWLMYVGIMLLLMIMVPPLGFIMLGFLICYVFIAAI